MREIKFNKETSVMRRLQPSTANKIRNANLREKL